MIKIILMIIALSCTKNTNRLIITNKGINEDFIRYFIASGNIRMRNNGKVIELLNKGADINFRDENGNTALFYGAVQGDEDILKILIEYGADINIKNNYGMDPLFYCLFYSSSNNKVKTMKKLIEYGADVNSKYDNGNNLLVNSACKGKIKIVKLLISKGASINVKDKNGRTALMEAIKHGYLKIIDILLKAGAECSNEEREKIDYLIKERNDINFVNEKGETALLLAVANEDLELAKSLIENGANLKVEDSFNHSLFAKAVLYTGNKKMIKLFLDNGADINEKMDHDSKTPLLVALERGNFALAKFLIKCGANIEEKSRSGVTALMYAAKNNCIEVAKMLVENKSDTSDFSAALFNAALFGHLEIIKLLWEKTGNLKEYQEKTLLEASFRGYDDILRWLIERGIEINIEFSTTPYNNYPYHSTTPLITASQRIDIIGTAKLLIEKGADVNKKDSSNFTPLMSASRNGNLELVKLFLELNSDMNVEDNRGETAFSYALTNNHREIARLILEKNVNTSTDINTKGNKGITLLMQAAILGDKEIADLLISKEAKVNEKDNSNITALMYASKNGHLELVKLFLEFGADINEKSNIGYTPLIYSITNGHLEILNFLLEKGANITVKDIDTPIDRNGYGRIVEHKYSPLFYVVHKGYLEVLKVLIDKFANLNLEFKYYEDTLLTTSIMQGHTKIVEFLIEKGVCINKSYSYNSKSKSPFSTALEKRNLEILKLLIEKGVSLTALDMSALINAIEWNATLARALIDKGIVIYIKDQESKTLLMHIGEKIKNCKEKDKKVKYIGIVYMIIRKMAEDYIQLFISMNKNSSTSQEAKDEVNNHINMLYSLQKLPPELFIEIITRF